MNDLSNLEPEAVLENIPEEHSKVREIVEARLQHFVGLYIARAKLYATLNQILKEMAVLYRRDIRTQATGGKVFDAEGIREVEDIGQMGRILEDAERRMAAVGSPMAAAPASDEVSFD